MCVKNKLQSPLHRRWRLSFLLFFPKPANQHYPLYPLEGRRCRKLKHSRWHLGIAPDCAWGTIALLEIKQTGCIKGKFIVLSLQPNSSQLNLIRLFNKLAFDLFIILNRNFFFFFFCCTFWTSLRLFFV